MCSIVMYNCFGEGLFIGVVPGNGQVISSLLFALSPFSLYIFHPLSSLFLLFHLFRSLALCFNILFFCITFTFTLSWLVFLIYCLFLVFLIVVFRSLVFHYRTSLFSFFHFHHPLPSSFPSSFNLSRFSSSLFFIHHLFLSVHIYIFHLGSSSNLP